MTTKKQQNLVNFSTCRSPTTSFCCTPRKLTWDLKINGLELFPFPAGSFSVPCSVSQRCLALGWCKMGPIQFVISSHWRFHSFHTFHPNPRDPEVKGVLFWYVLGVQSYQTSATGCICISGWWLNQPICKKNISPIGWFPEVGVKIKNIWNHQLDIHPFQVNTSLLGMKKDIVERYHSRDFFLPSVQSTNSRQKYAW